MNKRPKISVIVPVYNVELYIERCVDSILNQSFADLELILIDDGSTDNSGKICDGYVDKDSRVLIFHNDNRGVSASRNYGIKKANGEWICFVDGDDWLDKSILQILFGYEQIADLIQFKYNVIGSEDIFNGESVLSVAYMSQKNYLNCQYYNPNCWGYIFNRKKIIENNLFFPENIKIAEDQAFVLKYLAVCENILISPEKGYNYYVREGSAMNSSSSFNKAADHLLAIEDVCNFLRDRDLFGLTVCKLYKCVFYTLITSFWHYAWIYSGKLKNIISFNRIYKSFIKSTGIPASNPKMKLWQYRIVNFIHCMKVRVFVAH